MVGHGSWLRKWGASDDDDDDDGDTITLADVIDMHVRHTPPPE